MKNKRFFKSVISLVLSVVMITGSASAVLAAVPLNGKRETTIPTVYVAGYGSAIYNDKNDKSSGLAYSSNVLSDKTLDTLLKGFKEPLMHGIKTDDWTPYCDFIVNTCKDDLSKFALDKNGDATNGTGNDCIQDKNVYNRKNKEGRYNFYTYQFIYDWRLDPFVLAEQLNTYIENVKRVTGSKRVNLVGRCLGGNIVMTYLHEYGYDSVNSLTYYIGLFDGADFIGAMFSGKVSVDPDALAKYIKAKIPENGSKNTKLMRTVVELMNTINMLNLPIDLVTKVYEQIYENVVPRLLIGSYATLPSFWTFVGDRYYDSARKLIFAGREDEYKTLTARIDRYHNEIFLHTTEIMQGALDRGINVYNFVKYGGAMVPICKEAAYANDGTTTVKSQSFGSKGAEIHFPFDSTYLRKAEKAGNGKYISADGLIDASGDILRDHTWFIKGPEHIVMPESVNILMANVVEANGDRDASHYVTTDHFESYPRFLLASANSTDATVTPLTAENAHEGESDYESNPFIRLLNQLRRMFNKIISFIKNLFGGIK